jgi:hypothetical protein
VPSKAICGQVADEGRGAQECDQRGEAGGVGARLTGALSVSLLWVWSQINDMFARQQPIYTQNPPSPAGGVAIVSKPSGISSAQRRWRRLPPVASARTADEFGELTHVAQPPLNSN